MMSTGSHAQEFVAYLQQFNKRDTRAALAALRRGLGRMPGEAPEMFPYLAKWVPESASRPTWTEQVYYLVASLFAFHPVALGHIASKPQVRNLGASLFRLNAERGGRGVERRFIALLNSHRDDVASHLRQIIALLRSGNEIGVDWEQLLRDLIDWDHPTRRVQRAWASTFWDEKRNWTNPEQSTTAEPTTISAFTNEETEGSNDS